MATTHAFVGLALASAVAALDPALAMPAAVGGAAGGLFPDLDLAGAHRKTLHYPVYYSVLAVPAVALAVLFPSALAVAAALFLVSAAVHSASDMFGGGLELKPWEATSDRAVYVHPTRTWIRPRRWVRYDGSPEDFVVGALFSVPALLTFGGRIRTLVLAALAGSLAYTVFRKRIVEWAPEWME
ncbi:MULTISPECIES: metal-dependent hydrolase [Halostella]|uniref:metal-dependent hydrolase n=1 Tax=Halostella TaxID=1843185 RepID=UPI001F03CE82|nr:MULTISPECIES: metal-dependent hydrolase [Halostella]